MAIAAVVRIAFVVLCLRASDARTMRGPIHAITITVTAAQPRTTGRTRFLSFILPNVRDEARRAKRAQHTTEAEAPHRLHHVRSSSAYIRFTAGVGPVNSNDGRSRPYLGSTVGPERGCPR